MASSYKYLKEKSVIVKGYFSILFFIRGLRTCVLLNSIIFKKRRILTIFINKDSNKLVKIWKSGNNIFLNCIYNIKYFFIENLYYNLDLYLKPVIL